MTTIKALFKRGSENKSIAFRPTVHEITPIVQFIQKTNGFGRNWFLSQDTKEESFMYPAFDTAGELTPAAETVLENEFKSEQSRFLSAWNGELEKGKGASMTLGFQEEEWPAWSFEISDNGDILKRLGLDGVKELLALIAVSLQPALITVARNKYFKKQVFKDRPGVGWMLYLPRVLTAQQVPEARALVPVLKNDNKYKGKSNRDHYSQRH